MATHIASTTATKYGTEEAADDSHQSPITHNSSVVPDNFRPNIDWHLPRHAWDSHVHVFEPTKFPYAPSHAYSPVPAPYSSLLAFEKDLSALTKPQNMVLVQPSPYGSDNSLILDLLANHSTSKGGREMRAISVIDPVGITEDELDKMDQLGVRGIRINTESSGQKIDYEKARAQIMAAADRISKYKHWKCQLYVSGNDWKHLADTVRTLPVKVIADHQGGLKGLSALPPNITDVTQQPGFSELIELARSERVFIKISAFYRSSKLTTGGYDDLKPLIQEFAKQVPNQLIWGSDWPHTGSGSNRSEETKDVPEKFRVVDDEAVLRNIREWVGSELWYLMTVTTPARVYQ